MGMGRMGQNDHHTKMPILGYWIPLTNVIQIGGRVGKKKLWTSLTHTQIIKSESKSNASCIPLIFQILSDSCRITLSFGVTSNSR